MYSIMFNINIEDHAAGRGVQSPPPPRNKGHSYCQSITFKKFKM